MDQCSTWQAPYELGGGQYKGNSPQAVCSAWGNVVSSGAPHTSTVNGNVCNFFQPADPTVPDDVDYSDGAEIAHVCEAGANTPGQTINCEGACTVSLALVSPELEPQKFQDMAQIGGLFAVAAVVILCMRKVFNFFDKAPHGDS